MAERVATDELIRRGPLGALGKAVALKPLAYLLAVIVWLVVGVAGFGLLLGLVRILGLAYGVLPLTFASVPTPLGLSVVAVLALLALSSKRLFMIKRILAMVVVAWLIATVVFVLVHVSPYDPIRLALGQHANEVSLVTRLRHEFGLDQPLWRQYTDYMGGLLHGNFGYSVGVQTLGTPVWDIIKTGLPVSLKLGGYSLLLALYIGLPVGLMSALKQNSVADHASQALMIIFYAIPAFVLAPICQLIFAVQLHWLPVTGWGAAGTEGLRQMILPVSLFALGIAGFLSKSFRSFMLEVLRQDYIRTARAKGLKDHVVIYLHACKNTLLPLASIVGPLIAFLVVGAFIIEEFFSIPGIGFDTVQAVIGNDGPVIEGTTLLLALAVVVVNMLTDIFYAMVDPRVKL